MEEAAIDLDGERVPDDTMMPKKSIQSPTSKKRHKHRDMSPSLWQTTLRESVLSPFLPPPVTRAIVNDIDPFLKPYVGPEATINVTVTLMTVWFVTWLMFRIVQLATRSGRAVADDDDNNHTSKSSLENNFDATVVLSGPRNSGKTRLFYQLCFDEGDLPTLMSIQANVGIATHADSLDTDSSNIRYMDWPGYAPLEDPVLTPVIVASKKPVRLVLVLDATLPVNTATDTLDQWLSILHAQQTSTNNRSRRTNDNKNAKTTIFVACHKMDLPKAKNEKRIKIQMRTELERLITSKKSNASAHTNNEGTSTTKTHWWDDCSSLMDLDDLPLVALHFCATTCQGGKGGTKELVSFCRRGILPGATPSD